MRRSVLRIAVGIGALALAAALTYRLSAPASSSSVVSTSLRGRQAIVLIASLANGQLLAAHDLGDARQLHLLPGSAIKPWTALALLRAKVVTDRDRLLCRRILPSFGPRFACSHPPLGRPLGIRTALADSCNYFFLTAAARLPPARWAATLGDFGLRGDPDYRGPFPLQAIGAQGIHVTPWALFQAWRKLVLQMTHDPSPDLDVVRQGLVECVRQGTGRAAQAPGWTVMGKTGTVAEVPDGRSHAWFLAAAPLPHPRVVLLVATAQGSGEIDAAVIAGRILRGWRLAGQRRLPVVEAAGAPPVAATLPASSDGQITLRLTPPTRTLRVRLRDAAAWRTDGKTIALPPGTVIEALGEHWRITAGATETLSPAKQIVLSAPAPIRYAIGGTPFTTPGSLILRLRPTGAEVLARMDVEAYVAGVVAGEAGALPFAAQQAMAILARTWTLLHHGQHRRQGFDFCDTTHCQVWRWADAGSAPEQAAAGTRGQVLMYRGRPAQVFYSANCGGETEAGGPPWTAVAEPYLIAQPDPYCRAHPRQWRFEIARAQLARWLVRQGLFQSVPVDLRVEVAARDASGRARWLRLDGPPAKIVPAESFRIAIGRAFGWNHVESTLFQVRQSGDSIVFSGQGLGHGVGLCQAGAAGMARQGWDWRAILAHYFPGTVVTSRGNGSDGPWRPIRYRAATNPPPWHFATAGNCRIRYQGPAPAAIITWCPRLLRRGEAMLERPLAGSVEWVVYATPARFIAATGEPGWKAAVTSGLTIRSQPEEWLQRRGRLLPVMQHEILLAESGPWLRSGVDGCQREGLVLALSGEGRELWPAARSAPLGSERALERQLRQARTARQFSAALESCYRYARHRLLSVGRRGYLDTLLRDRPTPLPDVPAPLHHQAAAE